MFKVIISSNPSLEVCAAELQEKINAILKECPKAIIGSSQAPTVHVPADGAPAFYASAILHEAPAQPQEETFSASEFMKKMGLPVWTKGKSKSVLNLKIRGASKKKAPAKKAAKKKAKTK